MTLVFDSNTSFPQQFGVAEDTRGSRVANVTPLPESIFMAGPEELLQGTRIFNSTVLGGVAGLTSDGKIIDPFNPNPPFPTLRPLIVPTTTVPDIDVHTGWSRKARADPTTVPGNPDHRLRIRRTHRDPDAAAAAVDGKRDDDDDDVRTVVPPRDVVDLTGSDTASTASFFSAMAGEDDEFVDAADLMDLDDEELAAVLQDLDNDVVMAKANGGRRVKTDPDKAAGVLRSRGILRPPDENPLAPGAYDPNRVKKERDPAAYDRYVRGAVPRVRQHVDSFGQHMGRVFGAGSSGLGPAQPMPNNAVPPHNYAHGPTSVRMPTQQGTVGGERMEVHVHQGMDFAYETKDSAADDVESLYDDAELGQSRYREQVERQHHTTAGIGTAPLQNLGLHPTNPAGEGYAPPVAARMPAYDQASDMGVHNMMPNFNVHAHHSGPVGDPVVGGSFTPSNVHYQPAAYGDQPTAHPDGEGEEKEVTATRPTPNVLGRAIAHPLPDDVEDEYLREMNAHRIPPPLNPDGTEQVRSELFTTNGGNLMGQAENWIGAQPNYTFTAGNTNNIDPRGDSMIPFPDLGGPSRTRYGSLYKNMHRDSLHHNYVNRQARQELGGVSRRESRIQQLREMSMDGRGGLRKVNKRKQNRAYSHPVKATGDVQRERRAIATEARYNQSKKKR